MSDNSNKCIRKRRSTPQVSDMYSSQRSQPSVAARSQSQYYQEVMRKHINDWKLEQQERERQAAKLEQLLSTRATEQQTQQQSVQAQQEQNRPQSHEDVAAWLQYRYDQLRRQFATDKELQLFRDQDELDFKNQKELQDQQYEKALYFHIQGPCNNLVKFFQEIKPTKVVQQIPKLIELLKELQTKLSFIQEVEQQRVNHLENADESLNNYSQYQDETKKRIELMQNALTLQAQNQELIEKVNYLRAKNASLEEQLKLEKDKNYQSQIYNQHRESFIDQLQVSKLQNNLYNSQNEALKLQNSSIIRDNSQLQLLNKQIQQRLKSYDERFGQLESCLIDNDNMSLDLLIDELVKLKQVEKKLNAVLNEKDQQIAQLSAQVAIHNGY